MYLRRLGPQVGHGAGIGLGCKFRGQPFENYPIMVVGTNRHHDIAQSTFVVHALVVSYFLMMLTFVAGVVAAVAIGVPDEIIARCVTNSNKANILSL